MFHSFMMMLHTSMFRWILRGHAAFGWRTAAIGHRTRPAACFGGTFKRLVMVFRGFLQYWSNIGIVEDRMEATGIIAVI